MKPAGTGCLQFITGTNQHIKLTNLIVKCNPAAGQQKETI